MKVCKFKKNLHKFLLSFSLIHRLIHVEKYEKKDKNSVLFKHMEEKHGGRRQQITVERLATCPGDPMLRQVSEAVYIQELLPTLNSKEEWGNSNIPRKRQNNNNRFLEDCDV